MKKVITCCLFACTLTAGYAQQHPLFTQYMFNGLVINPAYTGTHESATLTASVRNQWTGINGAPQTQVFSGHAPIKFTRSAAGGLLMHDKIGVTNQYTLYGTYAYHIPVSTNGQLSVGTQVGASHYNSDYSSLNIISADGIQDPSFAYNPSRWLPNLGLGAYYYTKKIYLGLSIPTVIRNEWNASDPFLTARQQQHYFLSAGYVMNINADLKLKPNVLLKWAANGPFQYDINANLFIKEKVWVGVSYRMKDSVDGILQYIINDQLNVGYSYGYPINSLSALQSGTHEIVLGYRIKKNKDIVLSPRYF